MPRTAALRASSRVAVGRRGRAAHGCGARAHRRRTVVRAGGAARSRPAAGAGGAGERPGGTAVRVADPDAAVDGRGHEHWARVLHELDRRRAHAFAAGDAAALTAVYRARLGGARPRPRGAGGLAGRGLDVHGAGLRLLDVRALRVRAGTVVLRVVDRLRRATARTDAGAVVPLPRDRPTVHRLVLRRGPGGWRIAAVAALSG